MLLLTRKVGENIRINDDVKVTIVEVKGNHVKLGIDAPPDVIVHREEIYQRILEDTRRRGLPLGSAIPQILSHLSKPESPGTEPSGGEDPPPAA